MLDRPPPKPTPAHRASDLLPADRQRRYRARRQAGEITVAVQVEGAVLDLLIRSSDWLTEAESADRAAIGRAISALLRDSARRR